MRIAHDDYEPTFEQLKNKTITLVKEITIQYESNMKTFKGFNPFFMDEIFSINERNRN